MAMNGKEGQAGYMMNMYDVDEGGAYIAQGCSITIITAMILEILATTF